MTRARKGTREVTPTGQPALAVASGSPFPAASERLVVLAASAGGLHALTEVLSSLPADFPAAIAVVQHRGDDHPDLLPRLLSTKTRLQVRHAVDGEILQAGTVYVCPPGAHMTAEHCVRLAEAPHIAFVRPSADLMLASAARSYGPRAISVVLSGNGNDGSLGSAILAGAGGETVVQEPSTARFRSMPRSAMPHARHVVPLAQVGKTLQQIVERAPVQPAALSHAARTTVLLADDHEILRDGLRTLLAAEGDVQIVAEVSDGHTAVRAAAELHPDVVVMDISMPDLDGVEATRQIKAQNPATKVIALSALPAEGWSEQMLSAGATRYLRKDSAFAELARAIRDCVHPSDEPVR